jgi:predicted Zn-dependent peptidase
MNIDYMKFILPNGLQVILHEDHSIPIAAVNVWYHVGSKDEQIGKTGFAHLFEHLMFEGSEHHNTSYFAPLQKIGASLNGSTNPDRTNYWEDVPANYLEQALWLESDRMGFLLEALDVERFDVQRDVVKNERRQSYENRPYGMTRFQMQPHLFPPPHPYAWLTIGSPEDLDNADIEDVKDFYRKFYTPSNASLAIAGDIRMNETEKLVRKYFDGLSPAPPVTRIKRQDSGLAGAVDIVMFDNVELERLTVAWPGVPRLHSDESALTILAEILSGGRSSRLDRSIVYEKEMAQSVYAFSMAAEIAGEFDIDITVSPGVEKRAIEEILYEELYKFSTYGPTSDELSGAKTRIVSYYTRSLERIGGFGGRADRLNAYNIYADDPGEINRVLEKYGAVTEEDVKRVCAHYLGSTRVAVWVSPAKSHYSIGAPIDRSKLPKGKKPVIFVPPVPERADLPSGVPVLSVYRSQLPLVAVGVVVPSGSTTDSSEMPGLGFVTGNALMEGTQKLGRDEFAEAFESMGSHLAIQTGREHSVLAFGSMKQHWQSALQLLVEVLKEPGFPAEGVDRVLRDHSTALRRIADDPVSISERLIRGKLFGQETPYGHPISGTLESVARIRHEDIVDFHGTGALSNIGQMTLIVVGDVTQEEVLDIAGPIFRGGSASREHEGSGGQSFATSRSSTIWLVDKPGAAQSVIRIASGLPLSRLHEDYVPMLVVNYILGGDFSSRLNMNLREDKGYTYGYRSSIDWYKAGAAMIVGGSVHSGVTVAALKETLMEITDLVDSRLISSRELEDAKASLVRGFPASFETSSHIAGRLEDLVSYGLNDDDFQNSVQAIKDLSLRDVRRVAASCLNSHPDVITIVGDRKLIETDLVALGWNVVLADYMGNEISG